MMYKATVNARMVFAWMVPITILAFVLAGLTTASIKDGGQSLIPMWEDYVGLSIATVGVLLFNWFEEKPQKASIETL